MPIVAPSQPLSSEEDVFRTALGLVSWNVYPLASSSAQPALTSQTVYAMGVPYRAGQVVTRLGWVVNTAASGTAPTGMFIGVSNATTMLMDSANLAASTAWTTQGLRTAALTSPLTIPATGIYYHLILQNGAFSVTQPAFSRIASPVSSQVDGAGALYLATAGTAATSLPAVNAAITLANTGTMLNFITFST